MDNRGGPSCVMVSGTHGEHPEWEGQTVAQIAASLGLDPVDTVMHVLTACGGSVACIYFCINEDDMLNIMKDLRISVGSDGYGFSFDRAITASSPHPRSFGTFPRFLRFVRERALMPLEDAVYKMTGLPASVLGLADRGVIREGAVADLTVFDWNTVTDTAEFTDSVRAPKGIDHVIVAGRVALKNGAATHSRTGGALLAKR
jgi:N-acyl-D-amino-acid deacylase